MRIGSLFSGYGGLDMAVQAVLGGTVAWYSEIEPAACRVLEAHLPGVPNLGDVTKVDWSAVEPVDVLTGGYPCQPFSHAGKRKGTNDERHLWPYVRDALAALRPMVAVFENVDGHRSLGLADVLGDIAGMGMSARWGVVRAADAGAPHGRKRVFIVAYPEGWGWGTRTGPAAASRGHVAKGTGDCCGESAADAAAGRRIECPSESQTQNDPGKSLLATADADSDGHGSQLHPRGMAGVEGQAAGGAPERQRARREPDAGSDLAVADAGCVGQRTGRVEAGCGLVVAVTGCSEFGSDRDGKHAAHGSAPADADGAGSQARVDAGRDGERVRVEPVGHPAALADAASDGRNGRTSQPDAVSSGHPERGRRADAALVRDGDGLVNWGKYAPAIRRWEAVSGRPAPAPTIPGNNGRPRLSPAFVEWMMGLPEGHVTGHGLSNAQALKMLGNGVVPQQAALALHLLGVAA